MKLYIKLNKEPKTCNELLIKFFSFMFYKTADAKPVATYSDKECTLVQCVAGKYRSFDDIYYLCTTYFPEMTPKDVLHELLILDIKHPETGVSYTYHLGHCLTMKRIRWIVYHCQGPRYNFLIELQKYDSIWSWKDLFDMIGIKSQEELYEYKKNHLKNNYEK